MEEVSPPPLVVFKSIGSPPPFFNSRLRTWLSEVVRTEGARCAIASSIKINIMQCRNDNILKCYTTNKVKTHTEVRATS